MMAETTAQKSTKAPYDHRIYCIWYNMHARCNDQSDSHYARYGGRGIKVCSEWYSYDVFFGWAMAHGYDEALTIDRIDNDGDYSPDNCRWATMRQQGYNRRDNVRVTVRGDTYTITEWANIIGVASAAITNARRNGVPPEEYIAAHLDAGYGVRVRLHPHRTNNISAAH